MQFINDIIGYGVFATKDIRAGELIGEYTGIVHPKETEYKRD